MNSTAKPGKLVEPTNEELEASGKINFNGSFGDMIKSAGDLFDKKRKKIKKELVEKTPPTIADKLLDRAREKAAGESTSAEKDEQKANQKPLGLYLAGIDRLNKQVFLKPREQLSPEQRADAAVWDAAFKRIGDPYNVGKGVDQVNKLGDLLEVGNKP